jgi:hypothetical protein
VYSSFYKDGLQVEFIKSRGSLEKLAWSSERIRSELFDPQPVTEINPREGVCCSLILVVCFNLMAQIE